MPAAPAGPPAGRADPLRRPLQTLFQALDLDGDGRLNQRELYALAVALALGGPAWPMPEDSATHAAAGWSQVFRSWCAVYEAPSGGFDLPTLGRALSASPSAGAGGFRISTAIILETAACLSAGRSPAAAAGASAARVHAPATASPPQPAPPAPAAGAGLGTASTVAPLAPGTPPTLLPAEPGTDLAFHAHRKSLIEELFAALDSAKVGRLAAGATAAALPELGRLGEVDLESFARIWTAPHRGPDGRTVYLSNSELEAALQRLSPAALPLPGQAEAAYLAAPTGPARTTAHGSSPARRRTQASSSSEAAPRNP